MVLPPELQRPELRLLLFGGRGGVGKTSAAAATAVELALARPERRVRLISVDPAHSLRDCFAPEGDAPLSSLANLEVVELDAARELAAFRRRHGDTLAEIARRGTFFDEADIRSFLELEVPGLDELFALLRIAEMTEEPGDHLTVVDTAPAGHTLRLLALPAALRAWLEALDTMLAKHRYLQELYRGRHEADEQDRFIETFARRRDHLVTTLGSPRARFVLVAIAEPLCLRETLALRTRLEALGVNVGLHLLNRVVPVNDCPVCATSRASQRAALDEAPALLAGRDVWALPLLPGEVLGESALRGLWGHASPLVASRDQPAPRPAGELAVNPPAVLGRAASLAPTIEFAIVTGKGGVGKTTVACALALRAAATRPVTLISTDPAPSLATCLEVPVDAEPRERAPGLRVCTVDAAARWRAWRAEYHDELETALTRRSAGVELAFDRQALDRLLDLSPPGVDEIMSVACVVEALDRTDDERRAGAPLVVLDNAATGHLLRLLEMPELLTRWIRAIFAVLLKYKRVLRMPRLSDRLITLSLQLKRLRALLRDPARARAVLVTLPTRMAEAEAEDLRVALARLDVALAQVVVNHQTPARAGCSLCQAIATRERPVLERWRARPIPCVGVTRGTPPTGIARVTALGEALFSGPDEERT